MMEPEEVSSTTVWPEPLDAGGHPHLTVATLMVMDIFALCACNLLAVWSRWLIGGEYHPVLYLRLWPCLGLFILLYELQGLYHGMAIHPGLAPGPAEEIRLCTHATTIAYLLLGAATFLSKSGRVYSRGVFLSAWLLTLVAVPAGRSLVRYLCADRPWWGVRCVVLGVGDVARRVIRILHQEPEVGLKPVAVLTGPRELSDGEDIDGVPVLGSLSDAPRLAADYPIPYAVAAMPEMAADDLLNALEQHTRPFRHVLVIPGVCGVHGVWVASKELGPFVGLEIRRNLLLPLPRILKRAMDLAVALALLPFFGPALVLLALAIRIDSRGPAFYRQVRCGREGRPFTMWKFRTMVTNGQEVLEAHFEAHPDARAEWERRRKLRGDPRITRLGRFLRRTSLDELPQIVNVLAGDMSLVGPRPIVEDEEPLYGDVLDLYRQVRPGLTGLWQVSGRNRLSFDERVALDAYYVRNWSVWIDCYILGKTVRTVLSREGAY